MPRPRKCRRVSAAPEVTYFKPRGVPLRELAEVYLPLDGYEAIRLTDFEGLSHEKAAARMLVSRQTFGRILAAARHAVAKALVGGMALRIHGGPYHAASAEDSADAGRMTTDITDDAGQVGAGVSLSKAKGRYNMNTMIAVSSEGPTLEDAVDPRFGRAAGFIIVDPASMAFEYVENGAAQVRAQGAGIQAAETVASHGVSAVLTGYVGPKAFQALAAAGIRVAQDLDQLSVREAVDRFNNGELAWSDLADAKGFNQGQKS